MDSPVIRPTPWTKLNTPAGYPAFSKSSANRRVESGVCSAGLKTMAHPAASAGEIFLHIQPPPRGSCANGRTHQAIMSSG
jgi:hypothetical protein